MNSLGPDDKLKRAVAELDLLLTAERDMTAVQINKRTIEIQAGINRVEATVATRTDIEKLRKQATSYIRQAEASSLYDKDSPDLDKDLEKRVARQVVKRVEKKFKPAVTALTKEMRQSNAIMKARVEVFMREELMPWGGRLPLL